MGSGNSTYGISTTSLTSTTAATFNNSQVFSSVTRSDWYASASAEIVSLNSIFTNNTIIISGKFTTNKPVNDIVVWHDREPFGGNNDYDAVQWATKIIGQDSFRFECPLADFYDLTGNYEMRIGFMHVNGIRTIIRYAYNFTNNIPDLSKVVTYKLLPTTAQLPKVSGSWINIELNASISTRYLKIESTSSWGDFFYSHLADFGTY